ncbi:hypothetical protein [Shewanella psychrotolerans]|uniref:hypothetical protein n=1 Tax=Shewanella psychrotolerans TaxID=2864206 RepID=UPI001C6602D8|nr:hypothetical protein [Shewanella psychrotolerans]QYK02496.1 hypothetical protein K0I62_05990 [Shewanella psychrotolerans]
MSIKSIDVVKAVGITLFLLTISACSSTDNKPMTEEQLALKAKNQQKLADAGYECRKQKVTGSSIKVKVCDTRKQREDRQNSDREAINDIIRQTPPAKR